MYVFGTWIHVQNLGWIYERSLEITIVVMIGRVNCMEQEIVTVELFKPCLMCLC